MSASLIGRLGSSAFRLSTVAVSMSLTGSCFSSESAPRPFQYGDSKTRWNNLRGGLAVRVTVGPSGHTNSPHPSSREGHHSTTGWQIEANRSNLHDGWLPFARERLIAFTPWHLDAVSGSHPPHLLMGWSGRAPAPSSDRSWEGAPKTRSTPCPRHSKLQSPWLVLISARTRSTS
jgi:hypothetical protein